MTKTAITGAATDSAIIRNIADEAFAALSHSGGRSSPDNQPLARFSGSRSSTSSTSS
jgi:hypothetical protein